MNIREEFEKDRQAWVSIMTHGTHYPTAEDNALWAAKWMAEKICNDDSCGPFMADKIRQLSKELSQ